MATPHVAGCMALLIAAQPEAPVSDIIQVLKETALYSGCRAAPDALGSIRVGVTPEGIYWLAHLEAVKAVLEDLIVRAVHQLLPPAFDGPRTP